MNNFASTELNTADAALKYIEKGWSPIPIPIKEKGPKIKGWQNLRLNQGNYLEHFNNGPSNIGINLGEASGGLVDIDLDRPESVRLAQYFLPPTGAIFGRSGSQSSHWIYNCPDIKKTNRFQFDSVGTIVEIRSNKTQTVFPPSIHTSGEEIHWQIEGKPAALEKDELLRSVSKLAAATLLVHLWPSEGSRNDAALALSGALCRAGWNQSETKQFLEIVAKEAGDEEWQSRGEVIEATYQRFETGSEITGLPRLRELLGEKEIKTIEKWLSLPKNRSRNSITSPCNPIQINESQITKWDPQSESYKPISTFSILPKESIYIPDYGESLKVTLRSTRGVEKEIDIPPEAWTSNQKFLGILPSREFVWLGTSTKDLQWLRNNLAEIEIPQKEGIKTAGFHGKAFITEDGFVGQMDSNKQLVFHNSIQTGCKLPSQTPASDSKIDEISNYIDRFNKPEVSLSILGWVTACFFKVRLHDFLGHFPILCLEGEAGSGKTSTVETIIMPLWALKGSSKAISEQTRFTFMKIVDSSNCIPSIFEENKGSRQNEKQKAMVSNLIRETYNAFEGQRGHPDQTIQTYKYQAPVCIVGEAGFMEPAVLDRIISAHFSKKESAGHEEGFKKVQSLNLPGLGRTILDYALSLGENEVEKILNKQLGKVTSKLVDRPRDNAAVVRFGLKILGRVLKREFDLEAVDRAISHSILGEDGKGRKTTVDLIIESMSHMAAHKVKSGGVLYEYQDYLENQNHYVIKDNHLRLYVEEAYPKLIAWSKKYSSDLDVLPKDSFKKQLRTMPYFIDKKLAKIGKASRNCYILDLDKMNEIGLNLSPAWTNDSTSGGSGFKEEPNF